MLDKIVLVRCAVGYLGEKSQSNWWPSEFCSSTSDSFLSPVFANTKSLARYSGVVEAGRLVHDESIGVGQRVFHLFRLPAAMEQQLHEKVSSKELDDGISEVTNTIEDAKSLLEKYADGSNQTAEGPLAIDNSMGFVDSAWLSTAAQCYLSAFENDRKCFPYIKASK